MLCRYATRPHVRAGTLVSQWRPLSTPTRAQRRKHVLKSPESVPGGIRSPKDEMLVHETDDIQEEMDRESRRKLQEDRQAVLKAADQATNNETRKKMSVLLQKTREAREYVSGFPTTVQELPDIPPYHASEFKHIQRIFAEQAQTAETYMETIDLHLQDLRSQPYDEPGVKETKTGQMLMEFAGLDEEEKEERLEKLKRNESATRSRLLSGVETFRQDVEKIIRDYGGQTRVGRLPNPFSTSRPVGDEEGRSAAGNTISESGQGKPVQGSWKTQDGRKNQAQEEEAAASASATDPWAASNELLGKVLSGKK